MAASELVWDEALYPRLFGETQSAQCTLTSGYDHLILVLGNRGSNRRSDVGDMRAARDCFSPARIIHQLCLEDLDPVLARIAQTLAQLSLTLCWIAHRGVHCPIAREQLPDELARNIAGASGDEDCLGHDPSPLCGEARAISGRSQIGATDYRLIHLRGELADEFVLHVVVCAGGWVAPAIFGTVGIERQAPDRKVACQVPGLDLGQEIESRQYSDCRLRQQPCRDIGGTTLAQPSNRSAEPWRLRRQGYRE